MVRPSHAGNVGAAARAIKTMGFSDLCLVSPRLPIDHPDAIAMASGATDILSQAQCVNSLQQALAHTTLSFALSARPRELSPPIVDIREAAIQAHRHLQQPQAHVAIVLGTERVGLSNEEVACCQRLCHIPANPAYASLNVAQALQLAAWELRYHFLHHTLPSTPPDSPLPAPQAQVAALITHWEQALLHLGFLNPEHPKKLMPRMQQWFYRSQLSPAEVDMMRGVCTKILKTPRSK